MGRRSSLSPTPLLYWFGSGAAIGSALPPTRREAWARLAFEVDTPVGDVVNYPAHGGEDHVDERSASQLSLCHLAAPLRAELCRKRAAGPRQAAHHAAGLQCTAAAARPDRGAACLLALANAGAPRVPSISDAIGTGGGKSVRRLPTYEPPRRCGDFSGDAVTEAMNAVVGELGEWSTPSCRKLRAALWSGRMVIISDWTESMTRSRPLP